MNTERVRQQVWPSRRPTHPPMSPCSLARASSSGPTKAKIFQAPSKFARR
jgi:hypothetical protein